MSGFSYARAEVLARREGISFREACARIGRAGGRAARRRKAEPVAPKPEEPRVRRYWWQEQE